MNNFGLGSTGESDLLTSELARQTYNSTDALHLSSSMLGNELHTLRKQVDDCHPQGLHFHLQDLGGVVEWMSLQNSLHEGLRRFITGPNRNDDDAFQRLKQGARRLQLVVHRPPVYLSLCAHALVSTFLLLCD